MLNVLGNLLACIGKNPGDVVGRGCLMGGCLDDGTSYRSGHGGGLLFNNVANVASTDSAVHYLYVHYPTQFG